MANEGPSLTKATYDKKRTRGPAPCPERRMAADAQDARDTEKSRKIHKLINEIGFVEYMKRKK
jgi:hypothetical protein